MLRSSQACELFPDLHFLISGADILKKDYNIEVMFALYLVDRSTDRSDKVGHLGD